MTSEPLQATAMVDWPRLLDGGGDPCVSLLMPTYRSGPQIQQNPTRLKTLLRHAEEALARDAPQADAEALLAPARALLDDGELWQQPSDGLAVFLAPDDHQVYRLPLSLPEQVVVGPRFHVKPILRLHDADGRFYVLALSQNHVRLLEATRWAVRRLELDGVPGNLKEALGELEYEPSLQSHTSSSTGLGRQAAIFHGHGGPEEDRLKQDLQRFFQQVAQGLAARLDDDVPLVLATVEAHVPLYRAAHEHSPLLDQVVTGSPDHLSDHELWQKAVPVAREHFRGRVESDIERYLELRGQGRGTDELDELLSAALQGRVETLFLAEDGQRWGRLDRETGEIGVHGERRDGDEDLLEVAARLTLEHRGRVHVLSAQRMPEGVAAAALFRY